MAELYPEPWAADTSLKLCVFLGSWFPFKIHQPVKCSWTLAHPWTVSITTWTYGEGCGMDKNGCQSRGGWSFAGVGVGQGAHPECFLVPSVHDVDWTWVKGTLSHLRAFNILIHPRYYFLSTWHNLSGHFLPLGQCYSRLDSWEWWGWGGAY